ncbi:MAG TPA: Spy/CpxP family protein refolding chaperone [Burkholderiales bacterium]|nr:Spy/CpxP family protein refolding chaperone [Burkholderiales bacterium]
METLETSPQSSGPRCHRSGHGGARFGRVVFFLLIALAAGFVGGYAGRSFAHGPGSMMPENMDPAQMDEHVERMVKHLAVEVDATPEQKDKLAAIAKSAAHDLAPLRGNMKRVHQQAIDLLGAQKVDHAAIENLRAEQIALLDATTRRLTQALADAADVLTVEQRRKLAERAQQFGHRFHHG